MASGQANKSKKEHLVGQFCDYTLVLFRSGQVRPGPVRYVQVRSGMVIRQPRRQNSEEVVLFSNSFLVFFLLKYKLWGARKMMSAQILLLRTKRKN